MAVIGTVSLTPMTVQIFLLTGGSGQFSIENELYPFHVGDLFIINSNVEHTETSLNTHPLEYIVLGVENLQLFLQNEQDDRFCVVHFRNHMEELLFYLRTMQKEITLGHLAQIAHVSKYHIVHIFSKEYGIFPISYLVIHRIEESRQLLTTTDFSLSYIAHTLRFSSSSYFSQAFRKFEGISPTE